MNVGVPPSDLSHLLWRDLSIVRARFEKIGAALVAVRRALERHPDACDGVAAFLVDAGALLESPPEDFTAVLTDPYAYFWVRLAFDLIGATLRGDPLPASTRAWAEGSGRGARELLGRHLREFERLLLGACVHGGRSCRFRTPLAVELPFAIPGTRLSLVGEGRAELLGTSPGRLHVRLGVQEVALPLAPAADAATGVRLEACPVVELGGAALRLQPHLYHAPALDLFEASANRDFSIQREWKPLLEAALGLVRLHDPRSFEQIGAVIQVVAMQPPSEARFLDNVSHSDLPGAILLCTVRSPWFLADVLIHELHHNRLFFIEESAPFLEAEADDLESHAVHCSPWREDRRPLHGILHAVYVFIPATRFWLRALEAGGLDEPTAVLARDRSVRGLAQLRIGLHQLRRHARFTRFGRRVFDQLERDVAALGAEIDAAALPRDPPFAICGFDGVVEICARPGGGLVGGREALVAHLRRCGPPEQVEDILLHVFAADPASAAGPP
jgi:HEXXH motif-containing protein